MSPICKPHPDSPMKASFSPFDRSEDRCLGAGELRLVEGMQTSLTETVTVLSSRIRYLEDLVDTYRRELAEVNDIKISLRVKEIECHDLVRSRPRTCIRSDTRMSRAPSGRAWHRPIETQNLRRKQGCIS